MEKIKVNVELRENTGKGAARKIRSKGYIPAIVYGKDTNVPIEISSSNIKILRKIRFSESTVIEMDISEKDNVNTYSTLIKDVQYHPLTEQIIHIDFMKVSLQDKIRVNVPIILKGEPKGVKDGGILEQILRELIVEALPLNIPHTIEVDVSNLIIGSSLHISDIVVKENLKIMTNPQETIVTVVAKKEEEEVTPTVEGVPTEPEIIKEKEKEAKEKEETSKE